MVGTPVAPNHLTVLRLATGLLAALLYAWGTQEMRLYASVVFVLSAFLDRADGELARLADRRSDWGHRFDIAADLVSTTAFFVGLGIGLRTGPFGGWAIAMGLWTGAAIFSIYWLRAHLARLRDQDRPGAPPDRLFDGDDFLYLIAPITWLGWLEPFLIGASIGAPLFLVWVAKDLWPAGTRAMAKPREASARVEGEGPQAVD